MFMSYLIFHLIKCIHYCFYSAIVVPKLATGSTFMRDKLFCFAMLDERHHLNYQIRMDLCVSLVH